MYGKIMTITFIFLGTIACKKIFSDCYVKMLGGGFSENRKLLRCSWGRLEFCKHFFTQGKNIKSRYFNYLLKKQIDCIMHQGVSWVEETFNIIPFRVIANGTWLLIIRIRSAVQEQWPLTQLRNFCCFFFYDSILYIEL